MIHHYKPVSATIGRAANIKDKIQSLENELGGFWGFAESITAVAPKKNVK